MNSFLFLIGFAILFVLFSKLLQPYFTAIYCEKLLSEADASGDRLPARLLSATFPNSQIFNSLSLPIPGREGEEICLGTVAINRSGIYIICQIRGNGIIENPVDRRWKHMINGACSEFENPFRAQSGARELIEYYTKTAGLGFAKCHSLIVYSGQALKFTHNVSRQIIPASELNRRFTATDRIGNMTHSEVRSICKLLKNIDQGIA